MTTQLNNTCGMRELGVGPGPEAQVFLSAGEASGEHYGAAIVAEMRRRQPGLRFFGLGGPAMEAAGLDRVVRAEDVAVMGITEVVRHMPHIYGEYQRLKRAITARHPAVAVLIDFPDVNLRLARHLSRQGVPVLYFVSPQLWAWKKRRIRRVQRYVSRMQVIFPFEEEFYRGHGVRAEYVGHPLAEAPEPVLDRAAYAREYGLNADLPWIVLMPGSREREVRLNLPEMARAAELLASDGSYEFVLPVASMLDTEQVRRQVQEMPGGIRIKLVRDARIALRLARASVVASGTATVEAALAGNPFVVVYRMSKLSFAVASRVVQVPHVGMVNLIAGRRLVPELIQSDFTGEFVVKTLRPLLTEGAERSAQMEGLAKVRQMLVEVNVEGASAVERVASAALELAQNGRQVAREGKSE